MLHVPHHINGKPPPVPQLKQVEFDTFSLAGVVHSTKVRQMHKYFNLIGSHPYRPPFSHRIYPPNPTLYRITDALEAAHVSYGRPINPEVNRRAAILMIVQPNNVNSCDERPIEEMLWQREIPAFRVEFAQPVLDKTTLGFALELLFCAPHRPKAFEISVIYYRAAYDEAEYDDAGIAARVQLEKSRAIKCPSIDVQIAGSKKVQQELTMPGALERFLLPQEAARIRETFLPMYPLDDTEAGWEGRELALNPTTAEKYILKPSKEGGGHNVHGFDIPAYLQRIPQEKWAQYILMERIQPPPDIDNSLLSFRGIDSGPVVSELGTLGLCVWDEGERDERKVKDFGQSCFSFKSKASGVDEMSVVKGYGYFDSPWLV
ncbi:MAG: hypothetical protein LQ346_007925 [Caloplaca aetnensis]|nr:MAG: hypothetical protein LQ346_007925 [Caloplaca aetnensis]